MPRVPHTKLPPPSQRHGLAPSRHCTELHSFSLVRGLATRSVQESVRVSVRVLVLVSVQVLVLVSVQVSVEVWVRALVPFWQSMSHRTPRLHGPDSRRLYVRKQHYRKPHQRTHPVHKRSGDRTHLIQKCSWRPRLLNLPAAFACILLKKFHRAHKNCNRAHSHPHNSPSTHSAFQPCRKIRQAAQVK